MAKFGTTLYNLVLKRTSTFAVVVLAASFVFERGFDMASVKIFESVNKGVSIYLLFIQFFNFNFTYFNI